MKELNNYIIEKLKIDKDTNNEESWSKIKKDVNNVFKEEKSKIVLKFILNFIKRSKREPFKDSMFNYWEMGISKYGLSCQHLGWSSDGVGHKKSAYMDKVAQNYNKDHGTDIKVNIAGCLSFEYAGVSIFNIKEVVDALQEKYPDFKPDTKNELVNVL